MTVTSLPFDAKREEERLNSIFVQIDSEFEGSRTNAANAIRNWLEKHRSVNHDLQIRLVLHGTTAERNLRVITELQNRSQALQHENTLLRQLVPVADLRRVDRQRAGAVEDLHAEFVAAIVNHLYDGRTKVPPRGSAKVIAGILECPESMVRAFIIGRKPVPSKFVDMILASKKIPPPPPKHVGRRNSLPRKPKLQFELRPINIKETQANGS